MRITLQRSALASGFAPTSSRLDRARRELTVRSDQRSLVARLVLNADDFGASRRDRPVDHRVLRARGAHQRDDHAASPGDRRGDRVRSHEARPQLRRAPDARARRGYEVRVGAGSAPGTRRRGRTVPPDEHASAPRRSAPAADCRSRAGDRRADRLRAGERGAGLARRLASTRSQAAGGSGRARSRAPRASGFDECAPSRTSTCADRR